MNKKIGELLEREEFDAAIKAASELSDEFKYAEAIEAYEAIHESVADKFGISSWKAIHCLRLLAYVYWCSGDYEKSLTMNKTVLEWYEQKDDLKDEDALRAMKALIDIYNNYGRYEEAYNLSVKAVGIAISEYGEESELLCSFLKSLGDCCTNTGKDEEAVQHYNHFLNIANEIEEINKDTIALVYDGLGYAYEYTGKFQESERWFEINKTLDEPIDEDFICSVVSDAYMGLKQYDEAEKWQKKSYDITLNRYGEGHDCSNAVLYDLALIKYKQGEYDEAYRLCSKSVSNQKFRCFYLELKRNILLAMTETGRGNYEKSAEITERFLNDPETVKYDTEYARLCYAAAGNYKALKQYELAAEYAKKSAEIRRDIFDKNTEESEMLLSEIEALISTADLSR